MKCPNCGSPMQRMSSDDATFDFCDECSGLWLEGDIHRERGDDAISADPEFNSKLSKIAAMLADRHSEFHAFLDSAPLEIGIKDLDGRYVTINKFTEELYGFSRDEVRGKLPEEVFDIDDTALMMTTLDSVRESGKLHSVEVQDAAGRWYLATYFPIRNRHGTITSLGGLAIDVTSRREAEAKLEMLNAELEAKVAERTEALRLAQEELLKQAKLAMVGQLTATVSHELRNPMATMRTSVFLINQLIDRDNERVDRALGRIERSLRRCDIIIDELLDFARTKEALLEPLLLDAWIGDLLDEYKPADDIQLSVSLDAGGAVIAADSERLRRAVINLLDNACHALMKQRPTDEPHPNPRVTAATRLMEDRVLIEVSDNGVGMDEEVLQNCFEPLFSTKGFGTGLGLPAAKQILEQHEGGIDIASERGTGTMVTLWLPQMEQV